MTDAIQLKYMLIQKEKIHRLKELGFSKLLQMGHYITVTILKYFDNNNFEKLVPFQNSRIMLFINMGTFWALYFLD